ncbi:beta-galactosidase-like [Tigriopus californicus]|uniref:beta-galactosidase-like n=1 Tax=Tigriopus californicus TaxID=6832 RepID=UPI0027DA9E5D|nr:beta-galactosidase-like [Tigriopus californicus]
MKFLLPLLFLLALIQVKAQNRTFTIDYDNDTFLKDGKPFRYISGSVHYFRIPRDLWHDRLQKIRAAGFNSIQFVVQWNLHEPQPGQYNFEGRFDVEAFIRMAGDLGLYVILRPGPYICAERNGGGLPFWLYKLHPDIKLRSSDPNFLNYVDKWWDVLMVKMKPLLYKNGGPIIMSQLENEYGSYGLQTGYCDVEYLAHLRDKSWEHFGTDTLLYTTDGDSIDYVRCGRVQGAYATVDFGMGRNVTDSFHVQRLFEPQGPLVNSEYYPGWLDYWNQPHQMADFNMSVKSFEDILETGANVNVYMAHGGTSFAFENGANNPPFQVEPTSYDYDALISEPGDLTDKYFAFKSVIAKYLPIPSIEVNETTPKANYGRVPLNYVTSIFQGPMKFAQNNTNPMTFEDLNQEAGYVFYETAITEMFTDPAELQVNDLHDRANIYVNQEFVGILSRGEDCLTFPISVRKGDRLQLLVENQGRIGYGAYAKDFKGITSNVTLAGHALQDWSMFTMPLDDGPTLDNQLKRLQALQKTDPKFAQDTLTSFKEAVNNGQGGFWRGTFKIPCSETIANETFLNLPGWSKGVAFLNGFNLGRYWPIVGPQITLYVPSVLLKPACQENSLVIFEQQKPGCDTQNGCWVELVDTPNINGPTPLKPQETITYEKYSRSYNEL